MVDLKCPVVSFPQQKPRPCFWEQRDGDLAGIFSNQLLGYQKTAALKAAIELDLFSALAAAGGDLAASLRADRRIGERNRVLCDYLTVKGFLEKENGQHRLTPSSQTFLTRRSPAYIGGVVDFLASPEMIGLWLTEPSSFVRKRGAVGLANMSPDNPVWIKFARAMVPFVAPTAGMISNEIAAWPRQPRRLLDIAAGHGLFGISAAQAIPSLEVTAIDWPAVLTVAHENASAAGVAQRYRTIGGSAFDVDWGEGYDIVLLTNFLHHFDRDTCIDLLSRARRALAIGGRCLLWSSFRTTTEYSAHSGDVRLHDARFNPIWRCLYRE